MPGCGWRDLPPSLNIVQKFRTHSFDLAVLMDYQALARKWRPTKFSEIVGQEHVVKALHFALTQSRLHHAYLFTGTRGVGKTTIARILAKAMNCESRQNPELEQLSPEPCGSCRTCLDFDEGRFADLIEVDAASRTKAEDTRELMENVLYPPIQGKFKVYLIDEVHMLSGHSFNALLKTLEEPPPYVKFLLATTDPQKIPVTVLSRCIQFNLLRLPADLIARQMSEILAEEMFDNRRIEFEMPAVMHLAMAAQGSMRDGLSLLDQAITHGGGALIETTVSHMLGIVSRYSLIDLLESVAASDVRGILSKIEDLAAQAPDFEDVLRQLLVIIHHAAMSQWVPEMTRNDQDGKRILELAKSLSAEDLQLYYQICLMAQRDLSLAPDARLGFEMVMLRLLAFRPVLAKPSLELKTSDISGPVSLPEKPKVKSSAVANSPEPVKKESRLVPEVVQVQEESDYWTQLIREMGMSAMAGQLASNCLLESLDVNSCVLILNPKLGHLRSSHAESKVEELLRNHFKSPSLKLTVKMEESVKSTPALIMTLERQKRQQEAELKIEQDENVQALKEQFDARIIPGSIKPID